MFPTALCHSPLYTPDSFILILFKDNDIVYIVFRSTSTSEFPSILVIVQISPSRINQYKSLLLILFSFITRWQCLIDVDSSYFEYRAQGNQSWNDKENLLSPLDSFHSGRRLSKVLCKKRYQLSYRVLVPEAYTIDLDSNILTGEKLETLFTC